MKYIVETTYDHEDAKDKKESQFASSTTIQAFVCVVLLQHYGDDDQQRRLQEFGAGLDPGIAVCF